MTDAIEESNNFSFRTFDVYRKFVEVLQSNPDYLEEFKAGAPNPETCNSIIKTIYQFRQSEEKVAYITEYLTKNAELLILHAENPPSNWTEANKYTDWCIKIIQNYLIKKGITHNSNYDVNKAAEEISKSLYQHPTEKQIEIVKEYLQYDLKNPKKNIISASSPTRNTKKQITNFNDKNIYDTKEITQINKLNMEDTNSEDIDDRVFVLESEIDFFTEKEEIVAEYDTRALFSIANIKSQNELLHIEDQSNETPERSSIPNINSSKEYILLEIIDSSKIESSNQNIKNTCSNSESEREGVLRTDTTIDFDELSSNQDDKRLATTYQLISKKLSKSNNKDCKSIGTDISINEEICKKLDLNIQNFKKRKAIDNILPGLETEIKLEEEIFIKPELQYNYKEHYTSESNNYYFSQVANMSYEEALKFMDAVLTFCQMKNEISLEEFLVLRRTRDKLQWKSLMKEKHTHNSL